MSVLLDTGFVFALVNFEDRHHAEAAALARRIAKREWGTPLITELVACELLSLIRARTGSAPMERAARAFLPLPASSLRGLALAPIGGALLDEVWQVFDRYRDQKLSFVDASLLVGLRRLGADCVATFDESLAKLVPTAG